MDARSQLTSPAEAGRFAPPPVLPPGDLWVFGYGSLMWKPGFAHEEARAARLYGYHRAYCVYSWTHRGTPERPGLVFGLDRGGSCLGRAFRVARAQAAEVVAYLQGREMIYSVYRPVIRHARLADGRRVGALAYVVDRRSPQYAGKLDERRMVALVLQGEGSMGACRDYLTNTVRHMDALGIPDGPLHRLERQVRAAAEGGP